MGFALMSVKLEKLIKNKIIEDCAQAFGSMINGKMAGTISDYGCFSFHSQKISPHLVRVELYT